MSGLQWALLLQAAYFFGLFFVKPPNGKRFWEGEIETLNDEPDNWLISGIVGGFPSLPLLFTLLSLFLYPTAWAFIWLLANIGIWLFAGIAAKEKEAIISAIIGFVVLLINLKLNSITTITPVNLPSMPVSSTQTSGDLWSSGWFLPVKILIALVSVIGVLFLLRWIIREFFPNLDEKVVIEKVLIAVISGVVVTGLVYWFFGDPTAATVPGLLAAATIYLFNQKS
jgi:hypothetical protein